MANQIAYGAIHLYMNELRSQVVAKSGIPTDQHHLGKIILHCLRNDPDFVMQIDGATGESEANGSVLERSVRCAVALQQLGVSKGDVMLLMGPNHLHLCVPHYAALYIGVGVAAVDHTLLLNELKDILTVLQPKIIFCQSEKSADMDKALEQLNMEAQIVTFKQGAVCGEDEADTSAHITLSQLLQRATAEDVQRFQATDFDPAETPAYLTSTSGTTGLPKAAILTHQNLSISVTCVWRLFPKYPTPTRMSFMVSPMQWLSAGFQYLFSPIMKVARLQTSAELTTDHFAHLLKTYKPTFLISSPVLMRRLLTARDRCDFSCFERVLLGGSAVPEDLIQEVKSVTRTEHVYNLYGMSEVGGIALHHNYPPPPGSVGIPRGQFQYRLVDPATNKEITEANVPGELWMKGPVVFKGYYNNPEVTAATLTEDGWLKSGDILYRNEYWHFFFVERMKSLLKYMNHQIAPTEVEQVIKQHPEVEDVFVTGIPDKNCGDLVVACVIPKPGTSPTAQEIKDLVKDSLTDSKQLRGGVIFMKEFPLTVSSKINRSKLREMVLTMNRE